MLDQRRPPRPPSASWRAAAALLAAVVVGVPGLQAPQAAVARAAISPSEAGAAAGEAAPPPVEPSAEQPSIQYLQAIEHAGDRIDFEPGEVPEVPFSPRASDHWQIDGRPPRALPAGQASGRAMHDAPQGSVWAKDVPGATPADPSAGGAPIDQAEGVSSADADPAAAWAPNGDGTLDAAPIGANGLRREVLGFLPYWEISSTIPPLDYATLSTIAYFSVGCTSAGDLLKRNSDGSTTTGWAGWTSSRMTSVINAAHLAKTRVVLTISCFAWTTNQKNIQAALLGSATARANLTAQIVAAVRDRGADGVNLDFEPIVSGYADEFTLLVRALRSALNAVAPGYQLTFDTTGYIGNYPLAEATAPGGADAIFIMGYDYRGASSSSAGSISPLSGPVYDLTDTVDAYLARVSPSKVILGVPYYGRAWSTATDTLHAGNISGTQYGASSTVTYENAIGLVSQYGRRWDAVEQAPWTAYQKETCTTTYGCVTSWRQMYFDDGPSLRLRYDLVNRRALRGAGIWALGYDGSLPDLRKALADKFLDDRTPPVAGVVTVSPTQRDEGFRVTWTSYDDSTVTGYDLQVSTDGGAWATWLTGTTSTSAIFLGAEGHAYAYRVRAADSHGNVSPWPTTTLGSLAAPAAIGVGGFAEVLVDGLRMRSGPSTGAATMATLSAGHALQVIGGPATADGYTWYQVTGPIRQWPPVDTVQIGGWVAASGNGSTLLAPRVPVYATRVDAGIHGLVLNGGGARLLSPNGDGVRDTLRLAWVNDLAFDSLVLRIHGSDGSLRGAIDLQATAVGAAAYEWDGRLAGQPLPDGTYVVQLVGTAGATAYSAPSATPVGAAQVARFGVLVTAAVPTAVVAFAPLTASPTNAATISYRITFGGPVGGLTAADFTATGVSTGCVVAAPTGAGASWTVTVGGCSQGNVVLTLKAGAVVDAVSNPGPAAAAGAPVVTIDRTRPTATAPRASFFAGVALPSSSTGSALTGRIAWSAADRGGAGLASYEVARSYDGGAFRTIAVGVTSPVLSVALNPNHSYRFEVRARDRAGNVGAWVAGASFRPLLVQQSASGISYRGGSTVTSSVFSGGSARALTTAGSSVSYTFTGLSMGFVSSRGPGRGAARVYVDGVLVTTIDLYAPTATYRAVVFARSWTRVATHTLRVVVVGTPGRPRVDVDAFEIIR